MVSSQLEILGKRLENLGTKAINDDERDCAHVHQENSNKLQLYIKEHQNILE